MRQIPSSLLSLAPLLSLALGLAALSGCDPDNSGTGGSTTTDTGGTGGTGGAGGTGGSTGTPDLQPSWELEKIGSPLWEPVDYHQIAYDAGMDYVDLDVPLLAILPGPNHAPHDDLFIGPGAPHASPYDSEIADGIAANGFKDYQSYTVTETSPTHVFVGLYMVVPSAGAPTGKTPDSDAGPMIPNTVFPIAVSDQGYLDDAVLTDFTWESAVPPLDASLNPPFDVEGHSHFPMFSIGTSDAGPGKLVQKIKMLDAEGNGWNITFQTYIVPD